MLYLSETFDLKKKAIYFRVGYFKSEFVGSYRDVPPWLSNRDLP